MTQYSGKVIRKTPVTPTQTSASGVWKLNEQAAAIRNNSWPVPGVPDPISRSVRFRASANPYFTRAFGTSTSDQKMTMSFWFKRGILGAQYEVFNTNRAYSTRIEWSTGNALNIWVGSPGTSQGSYQWTTTALYRDPSAWYHVVCAIDTTQATATNRVQLWVNGVQVTSWSTQQTIAQNINVGFSGNSDVRIGYNATDGNLDGYLTEFNYVDGQALTASSFGTTDPTSGAWIPMPYTGTYGANGFYLNFKDNTSTTTLGYDYSGNSNNWTANNISLTAGTTYDSMLDVPTPWIGYNTDGGVSVTRGNYCTLNPLSGTTGTLSEGNLYFYGPSAYASRMGTMALPTSGKIYFEATLTAAPYTPRGSTAAYNWVGVALSTNFNIQLSPNGNNVNGLMVGDNGYLNNFGSTTSDLGVAFANGSVIGFAIDTGANTYTIYKDNVSIASGTIGVTAGTSLSPMHISYDASYGAPKLNFGQRPFSYTPPSGYKTLVTTNLPTPTITNGGKNMNAVLWTGNTTTLGVTQAITGLGFQPDFVWAKTRNQAFSHYLYDALRGVGASGSLLQSNNTNAQATNGEMNSFDSDGFTVKYVDTQVLNWSSSNNVGWAWKAGNSSSSNTSGSITSTVSANTTAGFSVVTYTGTGSAGTVGHGLGVTPSMIIVKERSAVRFWFVNHTSISATQNFYLNTTDSVQSDGVFTSRSSTTFGVGSGVGTNESGGTYVAYCWTPIAGYSAFGSYTGNGSADGPFVFTSMRPRWLMVKRTDTAGFDWVIIDTARDTVNVMGNDLYPNASSAEVAGVNRYDFLSNGFKVRTTGNNFNASGGTYIYAAFAEVPFKFANSR